MSSTQGGYQMAMNIEGNNLEGIGKRGVVNWAVDNNARIQRLDDGYYHAYNFGFGNVGFVITSEGVVVIDSTVSRKGGQAILSEIRKLTSLPIKYLIYTHGHGDHVGGARIFRDEGATIIGHRNVNKRFQRYTKLGDHHQRINSLQFQMKLKNNKKLEFEYPDIVYDHEYTFELGGKTFRLIHGKGESDDATVVYIPEDGICYIGDFIIWAFPNIGNPNKVVRYEIEWAEMLNRILSLKPKVVAPGHGRALINDNEITTCLTDTSDVLTYLHDECVKHINKGSTLDEMIKQIQLPERFVVSPYIQPTYGCLEFVIRGIHRRYTGGYDENPTNLSPVSKKELNRVILDLIGNREKVITEANKFQEKGNYQMALHLIDLIVMDEPGNQEMRTLKSEILQKMSSESDNLFFVNFYKGSAMAIQKQNN